MFTSETVIAIFFRFTHLTILIGLAAYAFKNYGMPRIIILMAKKDAEYDSLLNKQLILEESLFNLDEKIKQETLTCQQLKEKISKWQTVVNTDHEVEKNKQNARMEIVRKSINKKMEWYHQEQIKSSVHNSLITQLEKSLSSHFESAKNQSAYLEDIVKFMDRRSL